MNQLWYIVTKMPKYRFKILKEEVEELIEAAEIFNSKILDFIEKLNSEKIAEFRIKMETLLKQV